MPERFFIGNSVRGCSTSEQLSLLCGPPACGKTSLLFQFAFNCAAESGGKVVFICSKKRLEHKPPFLPQDIDPASDILGRIQMKYVEDDVEIKKYFAAFHLHERFPVAVIIDDFGDFFIKGINMAQEIEKLLWLMHWLYVKMPFHMQIQSCSLVAPASFYFQIRKGGTTRACCLYIRYGCNPYSSLKLVEWIHFS
ncbi:uncharacterized protein LOC110017837 isoform X6 [Phalaenopsis equestris]|uniref:uncharacterized protein LOC110017837 isoform X6 n=1 Tax=Phalaenopsis equestris TaxID=78828 RepID=UPI0009E1A232|nr:uncharacterized protein LOC110017837 isoform X6 [Phalaenopsis equestris]